MVKTNFKDLAECERALYNIAEQVKNGKITPQQAQAYSSICNAWCKARRSQDVQKLIDKVDGLEALYKAFQRKKGY
jgi:hypothetical protein